MSNDVTTWCSDGGFPPPSQNRSQHEPAIRSRRSLPEGCESKVDCVTSCSPLARPSATPRDPTRPNTRVEPRPLDRHRLACVTILRPSPHSTAFRAKWTFSLEGTARNGFRKIRFKSLHRSDCCARRLPTPVSAALIARPAISAAPRASDGQGVERSVTAEGNRFNRIEPGRPVTRPQSKQKYG